MPQSKTIEWSVVAVIAVIILGGVWWYSSESGPATSPVTVQVTPPTNQGVSKTSQVTPSNGSGGAVSASNNSDVTLNQDLSAVDSQISGLNSDITNVGQSLNDTPIPQGQ